MEDEHHTLRTLTFNIIYITKDKVKKLVIIILLDFFHIKWNPITLRNCLLKTVLKLNIDLI